MIDNLLHILIKVSRDKAFQRLFKSEKGKVSARLATICKRHLASTKLNVDSVRKISDNEWSVQSADQNQDYTIVLVTSNNTRVQPQRFHSTNRNVKDAQHCASQSQRSKRKKH